MAPLPAVPNVIEVKIGWTVGEDIRAATKLHFHTPVASPTAADLQTLANAIGALGNGNFDNGYSSSVKRTSVTCTELGSGNQFQGVWTGSVTGGRTGAYLPASTAVLVNFKIGRRYRGGKPRIYLPWGTVTDLTDPQQLLQASATDMQTKFQTWLTGVLAATGGAITLDRQVSISYYGGAAPLLAQHKNGETLWTSQKRATPVVDNVLGLTIAPRLATQRRRMMR